MGNPKWLDEEDDWQVLSTFLPIGWQTKARESGALRRCRKFENAEILLRTLLIHLADGCSLRETAVRAKYGHIASVSDVALLKRLKASGEWFRWMTVGVMKGWIEQQPAVIFGEELRIRVIDGSTIQEPGSTGSTWRIHYSIGLPSLQCDEVYVTSPEIGESFQQFRVHPGDVFLGDRNFGRRADIQHVVQGGGEVLVRINLTNLPLVNKKGVSFPLLRHLRTLTGTKLGDWEVWVPSKNTLLAGRVCALKKSKEAAEKARRKVLQENSRKGAAVKPETIEAAGYTFVFTTLDRTFSPTKVLEMYRGRWQIEIVFKRLKSIIGLGHLRKTDLEGAKAWIHGKLLVAFLIEALIVAGERFFPWGYPISPELSEVPLSLEGDLIDAAPAE
jgi:Transposase DDE domain